MTLSAPKTEEADRASLLSVDVDVGHPKDDTKPLYSSLLNVPPGTSILRVSSPDAFSEFSIEEDGRGRRGRSLSPRRPGRGYISRLKDWGRAFWKRNKGLALVLLAQVFGTLMNVTTRYGSLKR
jgi:hypothetical protein